MDRPSGNALHPHHTCMVIRSVDAILSESYTEYFTSSTSVWTHVVCEEKQMKSND